jgi:hypothetical protein
MKKSLIVIVVLILVIVGFLGFARYKKLKKQTAPNNTRAIVEQKRLPPTKVEIKELSQAETPAGFLKDFPFESGAQIIKNYQAQTETGTQFTRNFYSQKSPDDNFKLYEKYFSEKKWNILLSINYPNNPVKSLSVKDLEGNAYDISISKDKGSLKTIVNASVTQIKK